VKIAFGPFILDIDTRQVMRGEGAQHLSRKAFDLLVMLVLDRPNVVTKAELQERLWPATFVDEANLANLIAEIRQALGDHPRDPSFIRTIHRVGYAFFRATGVLARMGNEAFLADHWRSPDRTGCRCCRQPRGLDGLAPTRAIDGDARSKCAA
jgi:DNA-binding winged helix-turn-helix (wHTH) protein